MNKSEYASIEWSKKLRNLFPEAEMWFDNTFGGIKSNPDYKIVHRSSFQEEFLKSKDCNAYPAISVMMALEVLPKDTTITKLNFYFIDNSLVVPGMNWTGDSLPDVLCSMIEYLDKEGLLEV